MIKPDRIVTTTCPYCGVGCTLKLHVKDDFIFKVTSPFDSPVNHGNLCVKGRFGYDFIYHPEAHHDAPGQALSAGRKIAQGHPGCRFCERGSRIPVR